MKVITIPATVPSRVLADIEDILDGAQLPYKVADEDPANNAPGGFRKTDPSTSRKAAFDVFPRTGSQRRNALAAVASAGPRGATYEDVQQATGINGVWKRLSELKEGGWVEVVGERQIAATGSYGDLYRITEKARIWLGLP